MKKNTKNHGFILLATAFVVVVASFNVCDEVDMNDCPPEDQYGFMNCYEYVDKVMISYNLELQNFKTSSNNFLNEFLETNFKYKFFENNSDNYNYPNYLKSTVLRI